jgi:hypothetical protein
VVVDPVAREVTHIVVETKHRKGLGRLVPLDLLDAAGDQVTLTCDGAAFEDLEVAERIQFEPRSVGYATYKPQETLTLPYYGLGLQAVTAANDPALVVTHDALPLGEVGVHRGDCVSATDGEIGMVKGLVIDRLSHHVTHVLLQEGHLWGRRDVAIPLGAVTKFEGGIQLGLPKSAVQNLPLVDIERCSSVTIQSADEPHMIGERATVSGENPQGGESEAALSAGSAIPVPTDSVTDIDQIVHHWTVLRQEGVERQAEAEAQRRQFFVDFQTISDSVIRPAMQAAVDRLGEDGGGGLIEEREENLMHRPRIILWMSLDGDVVAPRQDLNPYLQLDADAGRRRIEVWEGDMWEKEGVSRAGSPWELGDVSTKSVTQRILDILRRAARHGLSA